MDFVKALDIARGVFDQYKSDQRKWWSRMDGTPILNDVAVRMATAFMNATLPSPNPLPTTEGITHGWPVPDGWKLVPIEPDDNMICDGFECEEMTRVVDITIPKCEWPASCAECADLATAVYRAMIAAAPLPPPPGQNT